MSTQTFTSGAKAKVLQKNNNDVVIVYAIWSAMTKVRKRLCIWAETFADNYAFPQGKKGGFKDTRPEELLSAVLKAAYSKVSLDPALIGDI
jgi:acetyl-CoA acyltransferase 1